MFSYTFSSKYCLSCNLYVLGCCNFMFISKSIFWPPLWFLLWPIYYLGVCCLTPHIYEFLLLISNFLVLVEEHAFYCFYPFKFLDVCFVACFYVLSFIVENVPFELKKKIYSALVGVFYRCLLGLFDSGIVMSSISLLIFWLSYSLLKLGFNMLLIL